MMRSLPPPRYSRYRTAKRIGRALRSFFNEGYITDSEVFNKSRRRQRSNKISRIRMTRVTHRTTARDKLRSSVTRRIVHGVTTTMLSPIEVLDTEGNQKDVLEELSRFKRLLHWLRYLPVGCSIRDDEYANRGYGLGWNKRKKIDLTVRL